MHTPCMGTYMVTLAVLLALHGDTPALPSWLVVLAPGHIAFACPLRGLLWTDRLGTRFHGRCLGSNHFLREDRQIPCNPQKKEKPSWPV